MRSTFITDEYSQDLVSAVRFATEVKLDCLELRSLWGRNVSALSQDDLSLARSILNSAGLDVCVVDTFVFKRGFGSPQDRQRDLALADRAADIAAFLGASAIRIFAFWSDGAPEIPVVADEIRRVAQVTRDRGIRLFVENGTFSAVGEGSTLAELLRMIDDSRVCALWDPGNVINGGWPESVDVGVRALAGLIGHVHVKNPHVGSPGQFAFGPIAGGVIDWHAQIAALRESRYKGLLSVETHWREGRVIKGRRALDFPEGGAFSEGGATPTAYMIQELTEHLAAS
jgi:sugar phosphate isomerase/epimerase